MPLNAEPEHHAVLTSPTIPHFSLSIFNIGRYFFLLHKDTICFSLGNKHTFSYEAFQ